MPMIQSAPGFTVLCPGFEGLEEHPVLAWYPAAGEGEMEGETVLVPATAKEVHAPTSYFAIRYPDGRLFSMVSLTFVSDDQLMDDIESLFAGIRVGDVVDSNKRVVGQTTVGNVHPFPREPKNG